MCQDAGHDESQEGHDDRKDDKYSNDHLPKIGFHVRFFSSPAVLTKQMPQMVSQTQDAYKNEKDGRKGGVIADGQIRTHHDPWIVLRRRGLVVFVDERRGLFVNVGVQDASIDGVLPIVSHHTQTDAD